MAANPMSQFEVYRIGPEIKIGSFDISFTNASLFMIISTLAILVVFNLGSKKNSLIPNKIQLLAELSYTFVSKMISDTAGSKGKPYFAFIFSLFMFVLFCNMFGMIPYTFTVTSHIIVTFLLAAFIFVGVTVIGFIKHGLGYLKLFVPMGDVFPSFSDLFFFKNFDFAISRRVLRGSSAILSKQPYFQLFVDPQQQVG